MTFSRFLLATVLSVALVGCDATRSEEQQKDLFEDNTPPCPLSSLQQADSSFFPVSEGLTARYLFSATRAHDFEYSWAKKTTFMDGTLETTFQNLQQTCDTTVFDLVEVLSLVVRDSLPPSPDGTHPGIDTTYTVDTTFTHIGTLEAEYVSVSGALWSSDLGGSILFDANKPVAWYRPTSDDSVAQEWYSDARFGASLGISVKLKKGVGLEERGLSNSGRSFSIPMYHESLVRFFEE